MKTCYYELLGVDKKATSSEIKKSYRTLSLKYHPDKNPSEQAKTIFIQLTEAYNVLSDPNERTWYDNNREKILFNKQEMSKQDAEMYSFGFNIWNYFTTSCFKGFDDGEGSFYNVYRDVFQKIKAQETKSFAMRDDLEEQMRKFQGFGDSTTILERVLVFYDDWENFTTYKTFVWAEDWDTREAPNRYVKREMEKENKKERQKQKKTYIKTIKDLVSFLKKRDPRYRQYLIKQKEEAEKREQEKKVKEGEKKKAKQQMRKVKEQMQQQRFKEAEEYFRKQNQLPEEKEQEIEEEEERPEFYCQICDKEFKSENQLLNHEKSKMHKQAVKELQKTVMSKDEFIEEAKKEAEKVPEVQEEASKKAKKKRNRKKKNQQQAEKEISSEQQLPKKIQVKEKELEKPKKQQSQDSDDDDTDAFMSMLGNKKGEKQDIKVTKNMKKQFQKAIESSEESEDEGEKKKGKAKLKKQKKEKKQKEAKEVKFKCNVCSQPFPSKTKLFEHIQKLNHAKAK